MGWIQKKGALLPPFQQKQIKLLYFRLLVIEKGYDCEKAELMIQFPFQIAKSLQHAACYGLCLSLPATAAIPVAKHAQLS